MTDEEWLSRNTDGPDNPYSRVYSAAEAADLLAAFRIKHHEVNFFDHRHWGAAWPLIAEKVTQGAGSALGLAPYRVREETLGRAPARAGPAADCVGRFDAARLPARIGPERDSEASRSERRHPATDRGSTQLPPTARQCMQLKIVALLEDGACS